MPSPSAPAIPLQVYDNFIQPLVDALRYVNELAFDILSFCMLEALANPEKTRIRDEDTTMSAWLRGLTRFCGFAFRKYNIELYGTLQYTANKLKTEKSYELLLLKELIEKMTGLESVEGASCHIPRCLLCLFMLCVVCARSLCVFLSFFLSLSINSINVFIHLSVDLSFCLSIYLSVSLSIFVFASLYLALSLSISISIYLSLSLFLPPPPLSLLPSSPLFLPLSLYLNLFVLIFFGVCATGRCDGRPAASAFGRRNAEDRGWFLCFDQKQQGTTSGYGPPAT